MVCIVLHLTGRLRDNQKRYRFTPSVSKWRMPDALSVDLLCGFGAKNLKCCAEFIQWCLLQNVNRPRFAGHFGVSAVAGGSVMVRPEEKCFMPEHAHGGLSMMIMLRRFVVKPATFAGMLPSCRLVRRPSGWALS